MICDANVDSAYVDNVLDTHDRNIDDFVSLSYFRGYDTSLDPYYLYLIDERSKIIWNTFFNFSFGFSMNLIC